MNETTQDELLDAINHGKAIDFIPITIYIAVLFIVGLIGNVFVIIFYSHTSRLTPTTRLIFIVAIIDVLICIVMPETFAELTVPYNFTSTVFCKIYYFTNYILCLWESYVLLAIGVFRYRKICVPFKKQFTVIHANYAIILALIAAVLITFPVAIFFQSIPVPLTVHDRPNITITGYECNTSAGALQTFQLINNVMILVNLALLATAMLILYGLAVKSLRNHNKKIGLLKAKTGENCQTGKQEVYNTGENHGINDTNDMQEVVHQMDSLEHGKTDKNVQDSHGVHKIPPGMTTMLFIITVIFIISYLPYVVLTIINTIIRQKYRSRSNLIEFVSQSYRLNSVLNPFVYGYYNKEFRKFVAEKVCSFEKCLRRKK